MSRSFKKEPIRSCAVARSEKRDKKIANRRFRASTRAAMDADSDLLPLQKEVSNVYTFAKDGKWYVPKDMEEIFPPGKEPHKARSRRKRAARRREAMKSKLRLRQGEDG